jgi:hypothetical protein
MRSSERDVDKISKEAAHYENVAMGDEECRDCRHFQVIAPMRCEAVEGVIKPGAWCKLWEAKSKMAHAFSEARR